MILVTCSMQLLKRRDGQALILFALIVGALMVSLIATILITVNEFTKDISDLKVRIDSYQATIEISQIVQNAMSAGKYYPTCVSPSGTLTPLMVGSIALCMPTTACAGQQRYCVDKSVAPFNVTNYQGPFKILKETDVARKESPGIQLSFFPQAEAQSMNTGAWMPVLSTVPTATIGIRTCAATDTCVFCGGPTKNSNCFRVHICKNRLTSCPAVGDYFEAIVAINFQK
jgi:hypothetical protein